MNKRFCIWGCGIRGKNVYHFMDRSYVCAFIDSSPALQGTDYDGIPVISYERFLKEYSDCIVIVSPHYEHYELLTKLKRKGIKALSVLLLPPEIFEMPVTGFFDVIDEKTRGSGTLFLYGLNLYSILLLEHYQSKRPIRVIPEKGAEGWLLGCAEDWFPGCLGTLDEVGQSRLYLTSNEYEVCDIPVKARSGLYDLMYDVREYYNPQIERFKGIHSGERCFIVATGPSLRIGDLECLKKHGELCISVNGIIQLYDSTTWRPDYYVLEDRNRFQDFKDALLGKYGIENMLIADVCLREKSIPEFQKFHLSFLKITTETPPLFSEDFSRGAYSSGTVV